MPFKVKQLWTRYWMQLSGLGNFGRFATRLASIAAPPHKAARSLAFMNPIGYISPSAKIHHSNCCLGKHVFLADRVIIFQAGKSGSVTIGDRVTVLRDSIIETGEGGTISIGDDAYIHPRCQLNAYVTGLKIGCGVLIAANCAFYPHEHGIAPGQPIRSQPLYSRGPIVIGDNAWLGTGVIVLGEVTIGEGAVIGAGAVVTQDVPSNAIAVGVPAKVVKNRRDIS
jgi:acetyltransferase-like isoleucine patch superfamily enzyme